MRDEDTSPPTPYTPATSVASKHPSSPTASIRSSPEAPTPPEPESAPSLSLADAANFTLTFFSTAPPEVLAATGVGAVAVLYVIAGGFGLLVVGVVVGAVGHASLSIANGSKEERSWRTGPATEGKELATIHKSVDFSSLPTETSKAMEELTDAVIRDYVRWWYTPILPREENFPNSCRNMLCGALLSMYSHVAHKRSADTFMLFLTSMSNTFIVFLRELAVAGNNSIESYTEDTPGSALAQMLDRDMQKRRLRQAADDIVQSFCTREALQCEPVRVFLTEIFAGVALEMTVDKFSTADWINGMIVYMLDDETQPELLQKIDISEATAVAAGGPSPSDVKANRISRAEEEMRKAMEEAKEMTRMIQEEEEERRRMSAETRGRSSIESMPTEKLPPASAPELQDNRNSFTSFDQLVPPSAPSFSKDADSLHKARVEISHLNPPPTGAERPLRSKPTNAMYFLQIERPSSSIPGWMVTRKYVDFETLHEVLRRISAVSGAESFRRNHAEMPTWRGETMDSFRASLERYLNDALREQSLAESEGMKRFLEKDTEMDAAKAAGGGAFGALGKGWPNPTAFAKMGQGALDALAKAPQGVAEGGKGLFGGMKKAFAVNNNGNSQSRGDSTPLSMSRASTSSLTGALERGLAEMGSDYMFSADSIHQHRHDPPSKRPSRPASLMNEGSERSDGYVQLDGDIDSSVISLPPPPSDMPDDYDIPDPFSSVPALPRRRPTIPSNSSPRHTHSPTSSSPNAPPSPQVPQSPPPPPREGAKKPALSIPETQFIVEILFALLSELYTLSSAWTLRRSLLTIAKNILLRPTNPTLEQIRSLIQDSVLDANTSDTAAAEWVSMLRQNVFPTKEEMEKWEKWEKEREGDKGESLREKARELWVKKGVPEALRGVMGAGVSEEALGRVFEALQERTVARGVVAAMVREVLVGVCQ